MTYKLCQDCKFFVPNISWHTPERKAKYAICSRTSLVTKDDGVECKEARSAPFYKIGSCGKNARFFELKTS